MTAGLLRHASVKIRETAATAHQVGDWTAERVWQKTLSPMPDHWSWEVTDRAGTVVSSGTEADDEFPHTASGTADHIALWPPHVALHVAALLEETANGVEARGVTARWTYAEKAALRLAKAILGEEA